MDAEGTFHLGLTMAGAISAGAYTAGVLDILVEALDRHNARFAAGKRAGWQGAFADHPRHRVVLRVISGTSAGGVSAGLAIAGLLAARNGEDGDGRQIEAPEAADFTSRTGYRYRYDYLLKPLHHVWVEALDLWHEGADGQTGFLETGDLGDGPVGSALNGRVIDRAATVALAGIRWNGRPLRFLAQDLDLFLTTTNLAGVPYAVGFTSASDGAAESYVMAEHATARHFRLSGLGTQPCPSVWLDSWRDHGIALPLTPGVDVDFETPGTPWARFRQAALATGAFPIGLPARIIEAEARDFGIAAADGSLTGGAWPVNMKPGIDPDTRPKPRFGEGEPTSTTRVDYIAFDGGVLNNEPFELARYTLRRGCDGHAELPPGDRFLDSNPRDAETADRAVLMIDPFPEGPVYTPLPAERARRLAALVPAARQLVPALIGQARFKPGELIEATDTGVHSRYLLAPSRRQRDGDGDDDGAVWRGAAAIAGGTLSGFGGFLDRSFRTHDYMLGRRNAHSFLKRYFQLRTDNPVLGLPDSRRAAREMVRVVDAGDEFYAADPPIPPWPRISGARIDAVLDQAGTRLKRLGGALLHDAGASWFLRLALDAVWSWDLFGGAARRVSMALRALVLHELISRDQHEDFRWMTPGHPFAPWQRAVLAALAAAGDEPVPLTPPRDAADSVPDLLAIAQAHGATEVQLRAFLDAPALRDRLWATPWRARGDRRYTLAALEPAYAWRHKVGAVADRVRGIFGR